jgi:hypothetical protein
MADSDRRSTLLDSYENAAVIVSGIDADELGHPTPCPKYDVAGLIDHLVEAGHRAAALGRGQAPPPGDESPHVELSDAPGQLRSAAEEAAQAWGEDSSLSLRYTMPWGEEYTGATLVDMYLAEPRHGGRTPAAPDRFRAGKPVRCGPRENPAPRASAASNCVRPAPPSAPGKSRRTGCSWPRPRKGHRTQHAANQLHPSLPGHRPCASQGSERRSPDRTCRCPACRTGSAARTIPEYAGTLRSPGASTAVPCA